MSTLPMAGWYDYRMVALSVVIAISASFTALDLATRVSATQGRIRRLWLLGGSIAMGQGIWSMHYIGMLAFHLPIHVRYDVPLVLLSLLAAVLSSAIALATVSRDHFGRSDALVSSLIMGSGIATMHYTGMAAMRMAADSIYSVPIVALSIAIAIVVSLVALVLVFHFRDETKNVSWLKLGTATLMGIAIAGMHYTGMAAVTYLPAAQMDGFRSAIDMSSLGIAGIGAAAVTILLIAILTALLDRMLSAQALELQDQAALLDLAHDSIIVLDLKSNVVFWNHGAEEKYGWSREEATGRALHDLLKTKFPQPLEEIQRDFLSKGQWQGELVDTCRDGSHITVASRWALQRDRRGNPKGNLEINTDITEQKLSEEILRESEARYRDLFEKAADLILSIGTDGKFLYVNPAWKMALGYLQEDPSQLSMMEVVAPAHRKRWAEVFQHLLRGDAVDRIETGFQSKDGRMIEVSGHMGCRLDPEGHVTLIQGIFRDVTKAREISRLKDEFVSVVSHELRTPLTSIRGSLGLLTGGMMRDLPEKARRMLTIALSNTERLIRLINDILDLERIQSGKVPMEKRMVDSADLMRQAIDVVQAMAEKANVLLAVETISRPMNVDADRIVQIFTNLLSNSIKFSPPGAAVHFFADAQNQGRNLVFKVKDTGRGIPADKLELVFERFQQVDASDSRVRGGTGLGIPICRTIVQQHHGEIWVESKFGEGSTFFVRLPAMSRLPESAAPVKYRTVVLCTNLQSSPTSLLAELESNGFTVEILDCKHPTPAFSAPDPPEAVLVDMAGCRECSGDILMKLREECVPADVPVIILADRPEESETHRTDSRLSGDGRRNSIVQQVNRALGEKSSSATVLIVEDDPDVANILKELFESDGVHTLHANSGKSAIELTRCQSPGLIVLDISLPDGDGFSVVNALRCDDELRKVPLMIYSAKDLSEVEKKNLELGRTEFFTKGRVAPQEFERRAVLLLRDIADHRRVPVAG